MMGFAQIRRRFGFFCSNLMSFAQIRRRFDFFLLRSSEFCTNPTKIKWKIQIMAKRNLRWHLHRLQPIQPAIKQIRSDLTRWFLRSAVGFLTENSMSLGQLWVEHKPDSDQPVDTSRYIHGYVVIIMFEFEFGEYCFIKSIKWKFKFWNFLNENLKFSIFNRSKLLLNRSK